MPPSALRSRNFAIGEASPSGSMNSILVLVSVANTVVTPCSGSATASEIWAPNAEPYILVALTATLGAIATWLSRPSIVLLPLHCQDVYQTGGLFTPMF